MISCRSVPTYVCVPCVCVQHQNFEEQMQGMKTQLIQLSTLLRLLDLAFWNYLGMMVFAHRLAGCWSLSLL